MQYCAAFSHFSAQVKTMFTYDCGKLHSALGDHISWLYRTCPRWTGRKQVAGEESQTFRKPNRDIFLRSGMYSILFAKLQSALQGNVSLYMNFTPCHQVKRSSWLLHVYWRSHITACTLSQQRQGPQCRRNWPGQIWRKRAGKYW